MQALIWYAPYAIERTTHVLYTTILMIQPYISIIPTHTSISITNWFLGWPPIHRQYLSWFYIHSDSHENGHLPNLRVLLYTSPLACTSIQQGQTLFAWYNFILSGFWFLYRNIDKSPFILLDSHHTIFFSHHCIGVTAWWRWWVIIGVRNKNALAEIDVI